MHLLSLLGVLPLLFYNDPATTEIYTLSLHDALPIFRSMVVDAEQVLQRELLKDPVKRREWDLYHKLKNDARVTRVGRFLRDRKSTRLNSSHLVISYAVFCLKKKKNKHSNT